MIDTKPMHRHLRSVRRWQRVMWLLYFGNVYFATYYITTPHALGVHWQALGVVCNVSACVFAWNTLKRGQNIIAMLRDMLKRAEEFNRVFR